MHRLKSDFKIYTFIMGPTTPQYKSSCIIPSEIWNKMSRADKRNFFKEQRALSRTRKFKQDETEGVEITVDSSTSIDPDTLTALQSVIALDD